jgi:hypothetical protein
MLSSQQVIDAFTKPESTSLYTLDQWNHIVLILRHEKLLARFYLLLIAHGMTSSIPNKALRHCKNAETLAAKQRSVVLCETHALKQAVGNDTSFLLLLKGAAYTLCDNGAALGRVYSDIDVLVPKHVINTVESRLAIQGWFSKELDDYDEKYYRQWAHEIPPMQHGTRGTVLDLHHNLVPPVSGKSIDIEKFVRVAKREVDGVLTLNDSGMFFHSAIHLFFNDDYSSAFRDMTDLWMLSKDQNDDFYHGLFALHRDFGFAKESIIALHLLKTRYSLNLPEWVYTKVSKYIGEISTWEVKLLSKVSEPKHALLSSGERGALNALAEARGHFLKMPIGTLAYHTGMKLLRSMTKMLFGKHIFTKSSQQH